MKREPGYYWVKLNNKWIVAYWMAKEWWIAGSYNGASDNDLDEIDERRIERQEYTEGEGIAAIGIPEGGNKKRKK